MEDRILKIYTYIDGINDISFPSIDISKLKKTNFWTSDEKELITKDNKLFFSKLQLEQAYISEYTFTSQRMGNVTLSATLMYERCLDSMWTGKEYVTLNDEKYFIRKTPTSSKDNDDIRYKHELNFVSERDILNNVYFYDVVTDDTDTDTYASNSTNVVFYGDIQEFVKRLNYSLTYSNVGYNVVIDEGITSKELQISFQDQFISNVLQEIFNQYELAYYFVGKTIHVGFTSNAIATPFKYGAKNNLLSITKENANYKIINRITGVGSSENIPFYYPNESSDKEAIETAGGTWITPTSTLMPSIYRTSKGANRFYDALNETYISPETGEYYVFENPYTDNNPSEHKITFNDIKPTIKGLKNASNQLLGEIADIAFDTDDNDDFIKDANGDDTQEFQHPYFFIKLHKFDGDNGFNLFEQAIEGNDMTISMTSGTCGACNFVIGVDEVTKKNIVQVNEDGSLKRDDDGNVIIEGKPQDKQNNTQANEVWLAVKKDVSTYGILMPNASRNYKPSVGDSFVILHIKLPQAYIVAAEKKLTEQIIDYMANNNSDKFNFSIVFSRIYLENNPTIANQINENARLLVEYDNKQYSLYVSTYTYKVTNDSPLPEITVDLTDTITINKSNLTTTIDNIKSDIMTSVGSIDFYKQGLKYFLRKDIEDYAPKSITFGDIQKFIKGLISDEFTTGALGDGFCLKKNSNGDSYLEVDRALFRKSATFIQLLIQELKHIGGQIILSPASMTCTRVEETTSGYKCYFKNTDGDKTIDNEFEVNDLARCQTFNLGESSNRYYWRKVISVGNDFIELSKTDADTNSTTPLSGDEIVQLGNTTDTTRQGAIVLASYGNDSPYIKLYKGINSFSLTDKDVISLSPTEVNIIADDFKFSNGDTIGSLIKASSDEITLKLNNTGINIADGLITAKTNKFEIKGQDTYNEDGSVKTEGQTVAVFKTDENGNPLLKADNIDVEDLTVKKLQTDTGKVKINNDTLEAKQAKLIDCDINGMLTANTVAIQPTYIEPSQGIYTSISEVINSYDNFIYYSNNISAGEKEYDTIPSGELYENRTITIYSHRATLILSGDFRSGGYAMSSIEIPQEMTVKLTHLKVYNGADTTGTYTYKWIVINQYSDDWSLDDGNKWYRKHSDGWLECGGTIEQTVNADNEMQALVELPVKFKNNKYTVSITPYREYNDLYRESANVFFQCARSTDYLQIRGKSDGGNNWCSGCTWEARGWWK